MESLWFAIRLLAELIPLFVVISTLVYLVLEAFPPERIQQVIVGRSPFWRVPLAGLLGALTPFCSCSTVPVVHGMRQAGVPTGPLVTFLIASPLVSPVAIALLWSVLGGRYALLYAGTAMMVAIGGGLVVAGWQPRHAMVPQPPACSCGTRPTPPAWHDRLSAAFRASLADLRKLAIPLVAAVVIGSAIHGFVPGELLAEVAGPETVWAIPAAALLSVPVYASTAVLLPLGSSLLAKGVGIGAVTAFLMGASGFSLPEGILLSRILPHALLARVLVVFAGGVIAIGFFLQGIVG